MSSSKARVIAWKSPSMKASAYNAFHLHCYPKWKAETRIKKYITHVHTSNNPARGTSCAYCRTSIT